MNIVAAFFVMAIAAIRLRSLWNLGKFILFATILGGFALNMGLGNMDSALAQFPTGKGYIIAFKHSMELFVNISRDRAVETRLSTHILSMPIVYHNDGILQILFGTSLYGRTDPFTYLPTDIAYLHMFSAFGLVGVTLFLIAYLIPLFQYSRMHRTPLYWAVSIFILMVVIANCKETALFSRATYSVHVFLVGCLAYTDQKSCEHAL